MSDFNSIGLLSVSHLKKKKKAKAYIINKVIKISTITCLLKVHPSLSDLSTKLRVFGSGNLGADFKV